MHLCSAGVCMPVHRLCGGPLTPCPANVSTVPWARCRYMRVISPVRLSHHRMIACKPRRCRWFWADVTPVPWVIDDHSCGLVTAGVKHMWKTSRGWWRGRIWMTSWEVGKVRRCQPQMGGGQRSSLRGVKDEGHHFLEATEAQAVPAGDPGGGKSSPV